MPEERVSPEDRLLKLIKGESKPAPAGDASIKAYRITKRNIAKRLNTVLFILLAVAIIALFVDTVIFKGENTHHPVKVRPAEEPNTSGETEKLSGQNPDISYAESRDLFEPQAASSHSRSGESSSDKLKDISLRGIIAGDDPQAVIEDSKSQKTYFLNKGQTMNGITVRDILSGRVIIELNGEIFDLTL
jgi:type II secretory pathway component PulC